MLTEQLGENAYIGQAAKPLDTVYVKTDFYKVSGLLLHCQQQYSGTLCSYHLGVYDSKAQDLQPEGPPHQFPNTQRLVAR